MFERGDDGGDDGNGNRDDDDYENTSDRDMNKIPTADTPNAKRRVEVTAADLPLHCPMPGKRLWDSHPKVYLPIEDSGQELCPYCGTRYVLIGASPSSH